LYILFLIFSLFKLLKNDLATALSQQLPLNKLRQARGLSQKMLADVLHVQQPYIAKIEMRVDM
jgi:hypothetical protein